MLIVNKINYLAPDTFLDINIDYEKLGISKDQARVYFRLYGLNRIPIINNYEELCKLWISLINKMICNKELDSIKYIIYIHTGALITKFGDSLINRIKKDLKLQNTIVFSTSFNKCSSLFSALEIANKLLNAEKKYTKILILSGEIAFCNDLRVVRGTTVIGDAVSGVLIHLNQKQINYNYPKILSISQYLDGKFAKGVWLEESEARYLESNTPNKISIVIKNALEASCINMDDIKYILPHNINTQGWRRLANNLKLDLKKIYLDMVPKMAHCFCSDFMINFVNLKDKLVSGDLILVVSIGVGSIFSAFILQV